MQRENLLRSVTNIEQHGYLKIMYLRGVTGPDAYRGLRQGLGLNYALSARTTRQWYQNFSEGRTQSAELPRSGRPRTATDALHIQRVEQCLSDGTSWSTRHLASVVGISPDSAWRILTQELQLKKRLGNWVPHELTPEQKEVRETISFANLRRMRKDPDLLTRVMAIDETWIPLQSAPPKNKCMFWLGRGEKAPNIPVTKPYGPKLLMICGMDVQGVGTWKILERGQNVNAQLYKEFLEENVDRWARCMSIDDVVILHDNASSHKSRVVNDFITSKGWEILPHPPYSPDLHPCDFNCFAPLKYPIKGHRYQDKAHLEAAVETAVINGNNGGQFMGINMLPTRYEAIGNSGGEYVF